MRLLAPCLVLLFACGGSGTAGIDTSEPQLLPAPASPDADAAEASPPALSDGGPTPGDGGNVGDLATVALTIDKEVRTVALTDANGFVPSAKLGPDGKTLEIRAWVTPPNTHEGGYAIEESFVLEIPLKTGNVGCGQAGMSYSHSRLYEQSPAGAPIYNPFEAFETKTSNNACAVVTKSITDTWVEGSASGTLTRTKSVNGTSPSSVPFTVSYRVPRR